MVEVNTSLSSSFFALEIFIQFRRLSVSSGLWHTWFDRDLGIAGRAIIRGKDSSSFETRNFTIRKPIARIPNLAIHLTAGVEREHFAPNLHEHCKAILSMNPEFIGTKVEGEEDSSARIHPALKKMVGAELGIDATTIEDLEMQLIDCHLSCLGGSTNEFIYSGRLDNLCSAYQSLRALIDSSLDTAVGHQANVKVTMLFDHEEIGSQSCVGAGSSLFMDTLKRIQEILGDKSSRKLNYIMSISFFSSAWFCCLQPTNYFFHFSPI
jgi:aspartyl aminopeptidase